MNQPDHLMAAAPLTTDRVLEIVRAASLAPSADNNQPWQFVLSGDRILARLDRHRALPSDVDSMFDLVALGAALENLRIAAAQSGHHAEIELPPAGAPASIESGSEVAAVVQFLQGASPDPLFDALAGRHTSRKPYSKRPPEARAVTKMARAVQPFAGVQLEWVTSRREIRTCARLIAGSDLVRLKAKEFHAELFRQLRFSATEAQQTCDGLDVRTLELPPGGAVMLKWLRRWNRLRWLHRLRLAWLLAAPTWQTIRRSGAIGILSVERSDCADFLQGGRALQRLWLTAHDEGLSLQPLGSLPIYAAHLDRPDDPMLPPQHRQTVRRQLNRLGRIAAQSIGRRMLMIFRIGYATRPRHRSLRRNPDTFISLQCEADRSIDPATAKTVVAQIETPSFTTAPDTPV